MQNTLNSAALAQRRIDLGLTGSEVATAAGISAGYYSDLENGRRIHPSTPMVKRLADVLAVAPADLLTTDYTEPSARPVREPVDRLVGTPAEVALRLGCSVSTVHALVREGRIPSVRYSRRRVAIPWAALERWLEDEAARSMKAGA